jgi:hypothetical protein
MRYDTERKTGKLPQVRITERMQEEIRAACTDLRRPVAWVVTEALRAWLDEYQSTPDVAHARSERNS